MNKRTRSQSTAVADGPRSKVPKLVGTGDAASTPAHGSTPGGQSTSIILETLDSSPLGLSSAKVIDEDVSAVTPIGPQPVDDRKIATDNLPSESSIADSEQVVEEGSTDDADERQDEEAANGGADVVAVNQPVAAPSPDQIFAEVVG